MDPITMQTLKRLEATNGQKRQASTKKRLKVFYGWSKINKIQKREAIAIAFENEELAGSDCRRSSKSLQKVMTICCERWQTEEEMKDAPYHNRVFTMYNVFLDDKRIGGSLKKALADNSEKDKNHVNENERKRISQSLETAFIAAHPGYQEPIQELELPFTPDK